ncbi:LCP family protein [Thermocoleostomius sinensis]|uniref:LCP family protein n=1 Tax=Thermocoleostomius sinensis A174 TaxID=2016057 RepID=A0A9E8ZGM2_9CYAN|nr:LCP family protein [Thermocoleostomius sinensis]WAL61422.1 LCP family protein [Thermocoleostomius sinensis A174]
MSKSFSTSPKVLKPPVSHRRKWLWLLLSLIGVASVSASAGALLAVTIAGTPFMHRAFTGTSKPVFEFNHDEPISTGMNFRLPKLTRPVNILVLGTKILTSDVVDPPEELRDQGYHALVNRLDGLTDTMLLVRFNPQTHQVAVLSLPRDTRTWVEGAGLTKLNEANLLGGPALTARSVSELLGGVSIDRYIRINVQGVEKLIDALGGVTVYVPQDMKYQDDSQHLYINLKKGEQHLNGEQAMQFLRFRYDEYGDIGRVQRQQMLMRELMEQALQPSTLPRLPQILSVIQSNLDTNLSVEELVALVGFAAQTDRPNAQMLMLPGGFDSETGAGYWLPSHSEIDIMVQQYFGHTQATYGYELPSGAAYVRVVVQDSTGDAYALQKLMNLLGNAGYGNVYVEDKSWEQDLPDTRIIAQHGDIRNAEAIHKALGFGEVLVESTGNLESDITIRLGQDALQILHPPADIPDAEYPIESPVPEAAAIESGHESVDPSGAIDPAIDDLSPDNAPTVWETEQLEVLSEELPSSVQLD